MLLLPPSAFQSTLSIDDKENQTTTVHEQLEQLQIEIGRLRTNNEALKLSGRGKKKRKFSFPYLNSFFLFDLRFT